MRCVYCYEWHALACVEEKGRRSVGVKEWKGFIACFVYVLFSVVCLSDFNARVHVRLQ